MNKWTWNNELSCHLDGSFSSQIKDYFQNAYVSKALHFSRSVVFDSATPWIAARQASLSITNSRNSLRFTSIESVTPSSHLILCHPLLLLLPIPPSIRVFSNESTLRMRWPIGFHKIKRCYHILMLFSIWLFCDPMDCSLPDSSVRGIFQARVLEWVAIAFSD